MGKGGKLEAKTWKKDKNQPCLAAPSQGPRPRLGLPITRYIVTLSWIPKALNFEPSFGKSRGELLDQSSCCSANFVSFESCTHNRNINKTYWPYNLIVFENQKQAGHGPAKMTSWTKQNNMCAGFVFLLATPRWLGQISSPRLQARLHELCKFDVKTDLLFVCMQTIHRVVCMAKLA